MVAVLFCARDYLLHTDSVGIASSGSAVFDVPETKARVDGSSSTRAIETCSALPVEYLWTAVQCRSETGTGRIVTRVASCTFGRGRVRTLKLCLS